MDCWELIERGPGDARHRALLLPGGLCTAMSYELLVEQPELERAGVATLAANPPGFAGRPVPEGFGFTTAEYAAEVERVAADRSADMLVGHSLFGNVLIEVAARGNYAGALVLIGPCLRRTDEFADLRLLDRVARMPVAGALAWRATNATFGISMRPFFPPELRRRLVADMRRNPAANNRRVVSRYFDHLDEHGTLADRLAGTRQQLLLVRGDREKVGFDDGDRARIEAMDNVTLVKVAGAGHFVMIDQPAALAQLMADVMASRDDQ